MPPLPPPPAISVAGTPPRPQPPSAAPAAPCRHRKLFRRRGNATASATAASSSSIAAVAIASATATGGSSSAPTSSATYASGGSASASATAQGVTILQNANPGANGAGAVASVGAIWNGAAGATVSVGTNNVNGGAVTVTGPFTFIDGITGPGTLSVGNGSSATTLEFSYNSGASAESALIIKANSTLDISNNHLFINYGANSDPIATIEGYLKSGYNGGNWNGPGIISSAAQANTAYGLGFADGADGIVAGLSSGQIEVKYTLYGDANLDGVVNGTDFAILAGNFGKSGVGWDGGDFNYNGTVNGSDFAALAANFGKSDTGTAVTLPASQWAALDAFAASHGMLADVPEPGTDVALIAVAGVIARRRRCVTAGNRRIHTRALMNVRLVPE